MIHVRYEFDHDPKLVLVPKSELPQSVMKEMLRRLESLFGLPRTINKRPITEIAIVFPHDGLHAHEFYIEIARALEDGFNYFLTHQYFHHYTTFDDLLTRIASPADTDDGDASDQG